MRVQYARQSEQSGNELKAQSFTESLYWKLLKVL